MKTVGLDIGSRYIKMVRMTSGRVTDKKIYSTIDFYKQFATGSGMGTRLNLSSLDIGSADSFVLTGYGKHNVQADQLERISEHRAHVLGAMIQTGQRNFILLDIGGQDTKIIHVVEGDIVDIVMNDKCAASSGRFVENMSAVLGMTLQEISTYWKHPVSIANTCAIFGESEVIGKIFEGESVISIAAGINWSVVQRVMPSLQRYNEKTLILTGGVALNKGVVNILKQEFCEDIIIPPEPQLNGAIGAAASKFELP